MFFFDEANMNNQRTTLQRPITSQNGTAAQRNALREDLNQPARKPSVVHRKFIPLRYRTKRLAIESCDESRAIFNPKTSHLHPRLKQP